MRGYPFTIRLKERVGGEVQPIRVKLDPGSKVTGIALLANEHTNHPAKANGKKAGVHVGRLAVRAGGSFNVQTPTGVVQGINARHCKLISPCRRVQIPTRGRASSAGLRQQSPRGD